MTTASAFFHVAALALAVVLATGARRSAADENGLCLGLAGCASCYEAKLSYETNIRICVAQTKQKPSEIRLFLNSPGKRDKALPPFYGSQSWPMCTVPLDERGGLSPKALIIESSHEIFFTFVANCETGIGPDGDRSFLAGAIYFAANKKITTNDAVNERFTELLGGSCDSISECDVDALAKRAIATPH
jgi:hypothetical protein